MYPEKELILLTRANNNNSNNNNNNNNEASNNILNGLKLDNFWTKCIQNWIFGWNNKRNEQNVPTSPLLKIINRFNLLNIALWLIIYQILPDRMKFPERRRTKLALEIKIPDPILFFLL